MSPLVIALLVLVGVVVVFGLIALLWGVGIYNKLVGLRQHLKDSWSGVDVELKRRYDLIPNLVETVKGYATHEQETLQNVIAARNTAVASTGSPAQQAKDESQLIGAMRQLSVVVERYPELKADSQFINLQGELAETENRIASTRRLYNGNVREMNNAVQTFPSNIVAGMFSFKSAEYFEIEDAAVREAPKVSFS
ncbi:MAG: LemA family protein [Phycisphaerales bacterium]|nr:LemA family protein [Phycisphaerales bacterium]